MMKITRSLFLFFICYLSTFLTAQENLRGLLAKEKVNLSEIYGNRWALVVGINDYKYFPILSVGVYLYQIRSGEFVQTKKMVLLK